MSCTLLQPLVPCMYVGVVYILPSCVAVINIAIITIALVAVYTLLMCEICVSLATTQMCVVTYM